MSKKLLNLIVISILLVVSALISGCGGGGGGGGTPVATAVCGNGKIETGETCDDGNKTAGDGC
ncbi:MAG: hypothetical protein AB1546_15210, partial [bacterium]